MSTSSASLFRRLAGYGIAASAASMTMASADADVVYYDPADVTTPYGANTGTWFSLTTGQVQNSYLASAQFLFNLATFSGVPGQDGIEINSSQARFIVAPTIGGSYSSAARLGAGQFVGAGGNFNNPFDFSQVGTMASFYGYFGEWHKGDNAYVGLEFKNAGLTYYGWAHVRINQDASITLEDFAYNNTPNTGLVTGVVPEPGTASAVLLGLGAAGLAAYRRRKANA